MSDRATQKGRWYLNLASDILASVLTIMADVINLSRFRKAKARADKARLAEEQRIRHGRSKIEKQAVASEQHRMADVLAGKWLVRDKEPEPG